MISDSNHVIYTCIAHQLAIDSPDSTILAEFNSADSSLTELAQQCLHHTPSHHAIFSQTFRKQTYTFLLDYPFVYFGIFDHNMIKFDQMKLLNRLKETLNQIIKGDSNSNLKFTSFCLQSELYPIFRKLMSKSMDFDALLVGSPKKIGALSPVSGSSKGGRKMLGLPIISSSKIGKCLKNKRMLSSESVGDSKEALVDGKVDVLDHWDEDVGVGEVKSREIICQNGVCLINDGHGHGHGHVGKQKAKKIWRRHVWIVLVLDLAVCLILFGIWLFVCRGFQCIER